MRFAIVLLLAVSTARAEDKPPAQPDPGRAIHSLIVAQVPRQHEDQSNWGMTIPIPPDLRRPGLRRAVIKVGDRMELPHGGWTRTKVWLDDPAKDVQVRVTEQRKIDAKTSRLALEATVSLHGERERQQWLRGLKLLNLMVRADAVVVGHFEVDVKVEVKTTKLLPALSVEPKVVQTKLELKQFDLHRVGPVVFEGKDARTMGEELRGVLQDWLRQYEPRVTEKVNEAVAKALKDGKTKPLLPPLPRE